MKKRNGYTLIELLLVVAILQVLMAISMPKFDKLVRKSKEASTKGNLGALRSALTIYYLDNELNYPSMLQALSTAKKYMDKIPSVWTLEYGEKNLITNGT